MRHLARTMMALPLALGFAGCSSDSADTPFPGDNSPIEIKINALADASRATDLVFETGDKVGIFVVNYNGTSAGSLALTGNHVDNMCFTYSGTWNADTPVYWKDNTTPADFYLYYPYNSSLGSVTAMPFDVKADQSTVANYKASDLLAGSTSKVSPSAAAVNITARHLMSQMRITLQAGNGFTTDALAKSDVSVKINGVRTQSTVNLATQSVTPAGNAVTVTPCKEDGSYKALIVPQAVAEGPLITVTVDGRDFNLNKAFTFESGKRHNFNVVLSKTSSGINVNISGWTDDNTDNGGTAE